MNNIAANLTAIHARITAACARVGRDPQQVRLIAVSKKKPAADIRAAATAGQLLFGESYVQEFCAKQDEIEGALEWHFIGGLQSNKVKYLRGRTALIHSVDRLSLAKEISRQWHKDALRAPILLQFNLGDEASKSGAAAEEGRELARRVSELPGVEIRGLMCLPPFAADPEEVRPYFRRLRQLAQEIDALALPGVSMAELSMGMSHDFEVAIEEGATLIRVGTAIFGAREN